MLDRGTAVFDLSEFAGDVLTPLAGKAQINNQPLKQSYELKPGDVVHISGVTLQFSAGE